MNKENLGAGCAGVESDTLSAMKSVSRWLVWKKNKQPYYPNGTPRHGTLDTESDLQKLGRYQDAVNTVAHSNGQFLGIGFALGTDEYGGFWQGVDLDDIEACGNSIYANEIKGYVELSPSEKGIHAIGYGRDFRTLGSNKTGIEAYAKGRFFTVTEKAIRHSSIVCLADYVEKILGPAHSMKTSQGDIQSMVTSAVEVSARVVTELRSALNAMNSDERELWVRMGHALKELGNTGRELWLTWSGASDKFDPKDASNKWKGFNPTKTGYQAVFAEAQRHGWVNPNSNETRLPNKSKKGADRELITRNLSSIEMKAIEWLWPGWIAKRYINLWAGETGAGKSTALSYVTSIETTGAPWPGDAEESQREPGRVLWLGSEDGIEELTVPRLVACNANLKNVTEIQGVMQEGQHGTFSLQDDITAVCNLLERAQRDNIPYTMLVLDPITSYLSGQKLRKVDLNDAGQLRQVLEPWLKVAQKYDIAIVAVTHFMKDTTRSMLHRVLGSAAFAQTCRSLCAVVARPGGGPYDKALIQVKVNLPEHPGGAWTFHTEKVEVSTDSKSGKPIVATRPVWEKLDASITPENIVGGTRGPVSKYQIGFGMWVNNYFKATPDGHEVPISEIKSAAIEANVVSDRWWNEHSGKYLDKRNVDGTWVCKPIVIT
jgi:hypothetical protein